jgi:hypothetical protein
MVAERAHVQPGRERRIRQHHVDFVHGEIRREPVQSAFPADDADRVGHAQRRFDELLRGFLRNHVVDAYHQAQRAIRRAMFERADELAPEGEDLVRVFVDDPADVGGHQRASGLHQEFFAQALLEDAQLRADGRRG